MNSLPYGTKFEVYKVCGFHGYDLVHESETSDMFCTVCSGVAISSNQAQQKFSIESTFII